VAGGQVHLRALVASLDGSRIIRGERRGPVAEARALGVALAEELIGKGADGILKEAEGKTVGLGAPAKK
jgi:hydroxymethylbilane synthase